MSMLALVAFSQVRSIIVHQLARASLLALSEIFRTTVFEAVPNPPRSSVAVSPTE